MTPQEKAKELVEKFGDKKYALLAIEEMLAAAKGRAAVCNSKTCKYLQQVKEELEKL